MCGVVQAQNAGGEGTVEGQDAAGGQLGIQGPVPNSGRMQSPPAPPNQVGHGHGSGRAAEEGVAAASAAGHGTRSRKRARHMSLHDIVNSSQPHRAVRQRMPRAHPADNVAQSAAIPGPGASVGAGAAAAAQLLLAAAAQPLPGAAAQPMVRAAAQPLPDARPHTSAQPSQRFFTVPMGVRCTQCKKYVSQGTNMLACERNGLCSEGFISEQVCIRCPRCEASIVFRKSRYWNGYKLYSGATAGIVADNGRSGHHAPHANHHHRAARMTEDDTATSSMHTNGRPRAPHGAVIARDPRQAPDDDFANARTARQVLSSMGLGVRVGTRPNVAGHALPQAAEGAGTSQRASASQLASAPRIFGFTALLNEARRAHRVAAPRLPQRSRDSDTAGGTSRAPPDVAGARPAELPAISPPRTSRERSHVHASRVPFADSDDNEHEGPVMHGPAQQQAPMHTAPHRRRSGSSFAPGHQERKKRKRKEKNRARLGAVSGARGPASAPAGRSGAAAAGGTSNGAAAGAAASNGAPAVGFAAHGGASDGGVAKGATAGGLAANAAARNGTARQVLPPLLLDTVVCNRLRSIRPDFSASCAPRSERSEPVRLLLSSG